MEEYNLVTAKIVVTVVQVQVERGSELEKPQQNHLGTICRSLVRKKASVISTWLTFTRPPCRLPQTGCAEASGSLPVNVAVQHTFTCLIEGSGGKGSHSEDLMTSTCKYKLHWNLTNAGSNHILSLHLLTLIYSVASDIRCSLAPQHITHHIVQMWCTLTPSSYPPSLLPPSLLSYYSLLCFLPPIPFVFFSPSFSHSSSRSSHWDAP